MVRHAESVENATKHDGAPQMRGGRRLRSAQLRIVRQAVRVCARCGHMTGVDGYPCRACGRIDSRTHTAELLCADRDPTIPALPVERLHSTGWKPAKHLRDIAGNAPARLILSRTRDHGISLGPVGLPGLVLDPRASLHVPVWSLPAPARSRPLS